MDKGKIGNSKRDRAMKKTKEALRVQKREGGPTAMVILDDQKQLKKGKYKGERAY